ncbi:Trihelix transcription factor GT-2, partial [Cucurbita argyrosperma subsp. sororia]
MEGVGGGSGSELFGVTPSLTVDVVSDSQPVEAASPISSRPPASSSLNYEELIRGGGQMAIDDDALVGEDAGGGSGSGGGGGSAGNRWPRQETLALLKIRSDMDSAFRDATLKGPLWDEVSRKLGEMGYARNAKKCKEKFENVQKYYKRTKEGRGGRGDGKTYKFFTQLEALHNAASQNVASSGFGISNPTPISAVKISQTPMGIFSPPPTIAAPMGVSFSSDTSSSSTEEEEKEEEEEEMGFDVEGEPSSVAGSSRKRRRRGAVKGKSGGRRRRHKMMMGFFEGLMKEVVQKQEAMQQRFLEAIERREEERMMREETWKRQEMGRLREEQEKMAQERTISGSRDAAIIAFLQKFTGQTIELPSVNISPSAPQQHYDLSVPVPAPTPVAMPLSPVPPPPPLKTQPPPNAMPFLDHPISISNQESSSHGGRGDGPSEPISSRWPKPEVLALIKLRGGLESRYQEMGPKGPLWEEISAGMNRLGYKRSAKRCKEKWENINKYFKKVKESNKKRREDSKTCPYFDELDALYRKKIPTAGGSDGGASFSDTAKLQQTHIQMPHTTPAEEQPPPPPPPSSPPPTKPEDIVNELMELQNLYHVDQVDDEDDDDDDNDNDDNDNTREEKRRNMDYKMEFQTSEFQSMAVVQ